MASSKQPRKNAAPQKTSFWTPTRIGISAAAVVLLALVITPYLMKEDAASTATTPASANTRPARPGELTSLSANAMQANFSLLDGKQANLASYSGKVVILDLWATWCGPCRIEIPYLIELADEFRSQGLEVIGLTTEDPRTDLPAVRAFVKEFKINYPIGWANREIVQGVMRGRGSIPQTLVFGRDGKIRRHLVGFNPRISPPQLREAVEAAIAE